VNGVGQQEHGAWRRAWARRDTSLPDQDRAVVKAWPEATLAKQLAKPFWFGYGNHDAYNVSSRERLVNDTKSRAATAVTARAPVLAGSELRHLARRSHRCC
jgi:hypothetical protein